jgi:hypothetical protein
MKIEVTTREANVIQVAIDHLYEMHIDILNDNKDNMDKDQIRELYHILKMIVGIHAKILHQLNNEFTKQIR